MQSLLTSRSEGGEEGTELMGLEDITANLTRIKLERLFRHLRRQTNFLPPSKQGDPVPSTNSPDGQEPHPAA